jgi:transcriptional regulator with XRE-family HTH domain
MPRAINPAALREIRQLVGVSQAELARRVGINRATLANIELGKHGVSPPVMRKLANALGSSIDAITIPMPEPEPAAS